MKYIYNINIISLCIILSFLTKGILSSKYIKLSLNIISFPTTDELSSITPDVLLLKLSKTRFQTSITIGSDKQVLPTDISFEHYPLYISSILCEENIIKFNQETSTSFINYNKIDGFNINQNCLKCNTSKDVFYFNNNLNQGTPLFFVLGTILSTEFKSVSAEIGFRPTKPRNDPSVSNILVQLKKLNLISGKNFMFHLNFNKRNGDLLLGAYNEKYFQNLEKFKYFYVSAENGNIEGWQFLLDNAYYGKKYIGEKNKVIISLNQYFIYVPFYMKQILDNDFFKELYDKKLCDLINLNKTSTQFYVCDDSIDINKMKNLSFFPINLNEPIEFILSPKDLFMKFGKNKLLYILGFNYDIDYWKFNLPFILKYQPIFDLDNKIITIYNDLNLFNESDFFMNTNTNTNGKIKEEEKGRNNLLTIIFFIVLCIFLIFIGFIITRKVLFYYRQQKPKENRDTLLEFKDMSDQNNDYSKDINKTSENKLNIQN